jgi:hypothetical protein
MNDRLQRARLEKALDISFENAFNQGRLEINSTRS